MITSALGRSPACMVAIVFLTCVWIPLLQLKEVVVSMIGVVSGGRYRSSKMAAQPPVKLVGCGFEEARCGGATAETCSVCLSEFAGDDTVSRLPRCRHVFHLECIEGWLRREHFSCPLCRSSIFNEL